MSTRFETLSLDRYPRALAWSPTGDRLVIGTCDGALSWIEAPFAEIGRFPSAHAGGILALAWDPRGELLATSGEDGRVRIRDTKRWETIRESGDGSAWADTLAWSPDGAHLAFGRGNSVEVLDGSDGRIVRSERFGSTVTGLAWRFDGKALAAAAYGLVRVFAPERDGPVTELTWKSSFVSLAWSPDGRHLAAGTQENTVVYWKAPFGQGDPLQMSGYASKPKQLAWDSRSRYLATGGGEIVTVWNVSGNGPAGSRPLQLTGHEQRVTALSYRPDGDMLASGGREGDVYLWNPAAGEEGFRAHRFGCVVERVGWSPVGGRLAVVAGDGRVGVMT